MKLWVYCLTFQDFTEKNRNVKTVSLQNTDITIPQLHVLYEKQSALKTTRSSSLGNQKSQQVSEICFFPTHLISMPVIYCVILHRCFDTYFPPSTLHTSTEDIFCVFYIFEKHKILQVILQARFSFAYFDTLQTISTRSLG